MAQQNAELHPVIGTVPSEKTAQLIAQAILHQKAKQLGFEPESSELGASPTSVTNDALPFSSKLAEAAK